MIDILNNVYIRLLGECMLWSLAIGAALCIVMWVGLQLKNARVAKFRYHLALTIAFCLLMSTITSFAILINRQIKSDNKISLSSELIKQQAIDNIDNNGRGALRIGDTSPDNAPKLTPWKNRIEILAPFLGVLWLVGVGILSFRYLGGHYYLWYIRVKAKSNIPDEWKARVLNLQHRIGIVSAVEIKISQAISAPLTFGFWKPIILVPIGFLSSLSTDQLEAIFIHELYHIKHRDYLINISLTLVEILFFYHPLMWWIRTIVHRERENYCDDETVKLMGSPLYLAKALTQIEEQKQNKLKLSLHFSNSKQPLTMRIMRLFEPNNAKLNSQWKSLVAILLALVTTATIGIQEIGVNKKPDNPDENSSKVSSSEKIPQYTITTANGGHWVFHHNMILQKASDPNQPAFLDCQLLITGKTYDLDEDKLYMYYHDPHTGNLHFMSESYASTQLPLIEKMKEEGLRPMRLTFDENVASLIYEFDFKKSQSAYNEDDQSIPTDTLRLSERNTEISIGSITVSRDKQSGKSIFSLTDESKKPYVNMENRELSWEEFLELQPTLKKYEYHLMDEKDGIAEYGDKARWGVLLIKPIDSLSDIAEIKMRSKSEPMEQLLSSKSIASIINQQKSDSNYHNVLFIIDGKALPKNTRIADVISPEEIKEIEVLRGEKTYKYGEEGKNGVILISTQKQAAQQPLQKNEKAKLRVKYKTDSMDLEAEMEDSEANYIDVTNALDDADVLIVLDDKIVRKERLKELNISNIDHLVVLKGKKAIQKYSEKGSGGVVEIYTKDYLVSIKDKNEMLAEIRQLAEIMDDVKIKNKSQEVDISVFIKFKSEVSAENISPFLFIDQKATDTNKSHLLPKGTINDIEISYGTYKGSTVNYIVAISTDK